MAAWIPNQPVFFGSTESCNSDETYIAQLVDNTDDVQFQFNISACDDAPELLADTNFNNPADYILPANWVIAYNQLCLSGSSAVGSTVTTATGGTTPLSIFTYGHYYVITIVVDSISIGGVINVLMGGDAIGTITSAGTYTFYYTANDPYFSYDYPLSFINQTAGTNICMSSVSAKEVMTNFIIGVYASDGTYLTSFNYTDQPSYFNFVDDTVTITIKWSEIGIQNGCYYLCVLDPCINTKGQNYPPVIGNCDFTHDGSWIIRGNAAYGTDSMVFSPGGAFISQNDVFHDLINSYCIVVTVSSFISGSMDVYFGSTFVGTITSAGTHVFTGTPTVSTSLTIGSLSSFSATITSACPCDVDPADYICNFISNNFSLGDYINNGCTHLINACNNENGLGFNFNNSGFSPRIRLESKLKNAKYPSERLVEMDSAGDKNVYFFTGRKAKYFCVDLQEEYVHDFLQLLRGFDNWFIDGTKYFVEDDEYTIEYSADSDDIGKSKFLVSTRIQNVKNNNCSSTINDCTLA